jgi:hypothetical protein
MFKPFQTFYKPFLRFCKILFPRKKKSEIGKRQKNQDNAVLFVGFVWLAVKFLQILWVKFSPESRGILPRRGPRAT